MFNSMPVESKDIRSDAVMLVAKTRHTRTRGKRVKCVGFAGSVPCARWLVSVLVCGCGARTAMCLGNMDAYAGGRVRCDGLASTIKPHATDHGPSIVRSDHHGMPLTANVPEQRAVERRESPREAIASEQLLASGIAGVLVLSLQSKEFNKICDDATLTPATRALAADAFQSYRKRIDALEESLKERLESSARDFSALTALPQSEFQSRKDELLALNAALREASQYAKQPMISALSNLEANLLESVAIQESDSVRSALRSWRRSFMMNMQRTAWRASRDLDQHPDLVAVIVELVQADQSLGVWFVSDVDEPVARRSMLVEIRAGLAQQLEQYGLELDAMLQSQFWNIHAERGELQEAQIKGETDRAARLIERANARWLDIYCLNERVALAVASMIESVGAPIAISLDASRCAARVRRGFFARYFPSLYSDKTADIAYRWLSKEADLDAAQVALTDRAYDAHECDRDSVRALLRRQLLEVIRREHIPPKQVGAFHKIHMLASEHGDAIDRTKARLRLLNDIAIKSFNTLVEPSLAITLDGIVEAARTTPVDGDFIEF